MAASNGGSLQCVVRNAQVVTPTHEYAANIGIRDGKIVAIVDPGTPLDGETVVDAQGRPVVPGVVDPHVHLSPRPAATFEQLIRSETRAAAAGGVTTIGLFVPYRGEDVAEWCTDRSQTFNANSLVDAAFHAHLWRKLNVSRLPEFLEQGVPSWKLSIAYRGFQARDREPIDDGIVWELMAAAAKYPSPAMAMVHAENPDMIVKIRQKLEDQNRQDMQAWEASRPQFVENECMRMCLFLAEVTGCRLYIVHITIGEGVGLIADAKRKGVKVVAETCPQYLTHNSEEPVPLLQEIPTLANVNPPLRDRFSNEKLWEGLRRGIIDCIGSDHATATLEEKGTDMWHSPMGVGNITEMILPVLVSEGVNKGRLSLGDVVRVSSANPAKALGLYPKKGAISVGSDADLVIVDLDRQVEVSHKMLHSRCDWSIWDGWSFKGWPVCTILRGQVICEEGRILAEPGYGRFLPRYVK